MSETVIVAAAAVVWSVVGTLYGLALVRNGPAAAPDSRGRKFVRFLIGFVVWPVVLLVLVGLFLFCWDLLDAEERMKELEDEFDL